MKLLLLLCGEAFRDTIGRSRDTDFGFSNQQEASNSHVKLLEKLESINYQVDIAINTYETKFKNDLLNFYKNIVFSNFTNENYGAHNFSVGNSIKNTFSVLDIDNYDFLFICRIDLLLKDIFIESFVPNPNFIIYPNVMSIEFNKISFPHISDTFCIIPKKYFHPFDNWKGIFENCNYLLFHQAVHHILLNGLTLNDVDFISDKIYVANTIQSKNPLYRINSRKEADDIRRCDKNLKYDKSNNRIIHENN